MIQYLEPKMDLYYFQKTDVITSSGELINETNEIPGDSGNANELWGWE